MADLSDRGGRLADRSPFAEYMQASRDRADRRWTPDRQDGFIDFSVAENRIVWDLVGPQLSAARGVPERSAGYDDVRGSARLRQQVADFAGRAFLGRAIDPASISSLAGAGAVLEAVFYALCDRGEGVLVPTPGYAGFWMDLEERDEARIIPVPTYWEDGFQPTLEAFETAYRNSPVPVRSVLVSSPDNPTGRVLSDEEIGRLVEWARAKSLHVVFDEIYALSVFDDNFTSVASVVDLGADVHIVWAFSKDFAVSGLRCGFLITENDRLARAVSSQGIWSGVSGHTQFVLAEMLADRAWTDDYVAEMRRRLRVASVEAGKALAAVSIPYRRPQAGFFLMADLRRFLDEPTFEAERRLWSRLVEEANVNVTPGSACRSAEPGFVRICFAAVPTAAIAQGIGRMAAVLG